MPTGSSNSPSVGPTLVSGRKTKSFVSTFEDYTKPLFAPLIFRRWAAISLISTALERKVWTFTLGSDLFPNLYILLVGPASAGKGVVLKEVSRLLRTLTNPTGAPSTTHLHVAPSSLTTSALIDELMDSERKVVKPNLYLTFHALQAVIPEFSDFAPMYDARFMSALQTLWMANDDPFSERRRTKDHNVKIHNPILGLIGGTTPAYLNSFMPDGAWDQGFISRTILIFSDNPQHPNLFLNDPEQARILDLLKHDYRLLFNIVGELKWTDEARQEIGAWIAGDQQPVPEHRKLASYNGRRLTQIVKLAIIAAVDANSAMITKDSVDTALGWLLEAEQLMPEIFKFASGAGDSQVINDCHFFLLREFAVAKIPVPEGQILRFIQDRAPAHSVRRILELMQGSGMIRFVDAGGPDGTNRYKPLNK